MVDSPLIEILKPVMQLCSRRPWSTEGKVDQCKGRSAVRLLDALP